MSDQAPESPKRDILLQDFERWFATLQPHEIRNDHERWVAVHAWRAALRESVPGPDLVRQLLAYGPPTGLTGGCPFCRAVNNLNSPFSHTIECTYRRLAMMLVP